MVNEENQAGSLKKPKNWFTKILQPLGGRDAWKESQQQSKKYMKCLNDINSFDLIHMMI